MDPMGTYMNREKWPHESQGKWLGQIFQTWSIWEYTKTFSWLNMKTKVVFIDTDTYIICNLRNID